MVVNQKLFERVLRRNSKDLRFRSHNFLVSVTLFALKAKTRIGAYHHGRTGVPAPWRMNIVQASSRCPAREGSDTLDLMLNPRQKCSGRNAANDKFQFKQNAFHNIITLLPSHLTEIALHGSYCILVVCYAGFVPHATADPVNCELGHRTKGWPVRRRSSSCRTRSALVEVSQFCGNNDRSSGIWMIVLEF